MGAVLVTEVTRGLLESKSPFDQRGKKRKKTQITITESLSDITKRLGEEREKNACLRRTWARLECDPAASDIEMKTTLMDMYNSDKRMRRLATHIQNLKTNTAHLEAEEVNDTIAASQITMGQHSVAYNNNNDLIIGALETQEERADEYHAALDEVQTLILPDFQNGDDDCGGSPENLTLESYSNHFRQKRQDRLDLEVKVDMPSTSSKMNGGGHPPSQNTPAVELCKFKEVHISASGNSANNVSSRKHKPRRKHSSRNVIDNGTTDDALDDSDDSDDTITSDDE